MNRRALAAEATLESVEVRELDPPAAQRLGEVAAPTVVTAGAADLPEIRRGPQPRDNRPATVR